MNLLTLFWVFFKFGLLCFGGGYVLVPLITNELVSAEGVENYAVLTPEMFGNLVAIAQMTPGPIGLNTATFVGYLSNGVQGGVVGSLALVLPGFLLVLLACRYLEKFHNSLIVKGILKGIRPASVALVTMAVTIFMGMSVFRGALPFEGVTAWLTGGDFPTFPAVRWGCAAIAAVSFAVMLRNKFNVIYLMLICAALGALICR